MSKNLFLHFKVLTSPWVLLRCLLLIISPKTSIRSFLLIPLQVNGQTKASYPCYQNQSDISRVLLTMASVIILQGRLHSIRHCLLDWDQMNSLPIYLAIKSLDFLFLFSHIKKNTPNLNKQSICCIMHVNKFLSGIQVARECL